MHKFLIKDGQGFERDFGSSKSAAAFAKKHIAADAVCARQGRDILWMRAAHVDYFAKILGAFEVVNTAKALLAAEAARKERSDRFFAEATMAKQGGEKRRVMHAKLGAGSVISETESVVTVLFDKQAKPMRIAPSFLTEAE